MKYLQSTPFSVGGGGNKAYADGWDRIFAKKDEAICPKCDGSGTGPDRPGFGTKCLECSGSGKVAASPGA